MSDANPKHLNMENARTPEQVALMEQIKKDGVCPFCAEHFTKYHPKPIIKETDSWFLTENMSPYKNTKHHFLFVYKKAHIRFPSEIDAEARIDLFNLVDEVVKDYHIEGGAFFMRFGDTRYNGSSVEHLHAHIVVGDIDNEGYEPVRVKMG